MSDARQPSFFIGDEIDPGVLFSTTTFEISSSPVRAVMVTPQVMSVPAFVMKSLEPLTIHEPSRSSAVVRVAPASEPASGSVRPKAASRRPDARSGANALLLVRPVQEDRHRPERGVCGDGDRDGRVDARELLDRDRVGEGVPTGAAVLLRDRKSREPEPGELRDELVREAAVAVELGRDRLDSLARTS